MALNISSDLVPQVINDYNAYTEDDLLIGLADEVTLPKPVFLTRPPPCPAWALQAKSILPYLVSLNPWRQL